METYQERVGRYRIVRHEELPDAHKAEYRLNGIDPDTLWSLVWSFDDEQSAKEQLAICIQHQPSYATHKIVDNGAPTFIERTAWF